MKANYHPPKPLNTYAAKLNALRSAKEEELISYGVEVGIRILSFSVNRKQHIANNRLIECIALARYLIETDFQIDPENAAEQLYQSLDKIMGKGWEEKADKLCDEWKKEQRFLQEG